MSERQDRCGTCRFWEDADPDEPAQPEEIAPGILTDPKKYGYCHRYPPRPTEDSTGYPVTDLSDWCGEWQPKSLPVIEPAKTVEQMCRDLLTQAVKDGLVKDAYPDIEDVQSLTSGDLVGMANMLDGFLKQQGEK